MKEGFLGVWACSFVQERLGIRLKVLSTRGTAKGKKARAERERSLVRTMLRFHA